MSSGSGAIPVLLLKTESTPVDVYRELLSATPSDASKGLSFDPRFVPVLLHKFVEEGLARIGALLRQGRIGSGHDCHYGGLVFTSQRAVEAFAKIVEEGWGTASQGPGQVSAVRKWVAGTMGSIDEVDDRSDWLHLHDIPIYSVGPATTRALRAIRQGPPLQIFGDHTGDGATLARYMLDHYRGWYGDRAKRPPLLFLVGEQRRDIIARTLMDPSLPAGDRIRIDEQVIYETGIMESFPQDFAAALDATRGAPSRWVVVFSPTGCDSMLLGLGMLDEATNKATSGRGDGATHIVTIGPTTRAHLVESFGLEPDVRAETPTPQGVLQAMAGFESARGTSGV